jgi:hypothetical protein
MFPLVLCFVILKWWSSLFAGAYCIDNDDGNGSGTSLCAIESLIALD